MTVSELRRYAELLERYGCLSEAQYLRAMANAMNQQGYTMMSDNRIQSMFGNHAMAVLRHGRKLLR